ncbi:MULTISPECIES: lysine N(6)-hydroxylase/L-ornithine N(5)-oxygenase family protein [Streptomyces]|uniref:L-lysine N6-monooxygenase MbtG n=2 Tax=Streptomyces TaxID=1883 RepID=A0ABV9IUW7_9ACTN
MQKYDLAGIGVGPANLSIAALSEPIPEVKFQFFDSKPEFRWHSGLMLPDSQLTVTHFRDLVTLVDPTSKFSFLNFLVQKGRAFRFLEANGLSCSRREFEQYFQWTAAQLPSIQWGKRVESVSMTADGFRIALNGGGSSVTRSLVLASGSEAQVPMFAKPFMGKSVLHSSDLVPLRPEWKGRRVVVIGAGQSGAEVVNHMVSDERSLPSSLTWTSSGPNFQPLDDSPFTDEWFSSNFLRYFNELPAQRRADILREQRNAGVDGITDSLMGSLYRRLYHLDHVIQSDMRHRLLTGRRAVGLTQEGSHYVVDLHDLNRGKVERVPADLVILCTGYSNQVPEYLKPIQERLAIVDGEFQTNADYSVDFDGPSDHRVYVQGFAQSSHGISDLVLSLASWRGASIINSVVGREVYRVTPGATAVDWQ